MLKKIGRYEILSQVGQGAMGTVYKARDSRIGRIVALKTILAATGLSKIEKTEFYERFYREARTAGNLDHPNIVTIHDIAEDPEAKISYIVMEFVEGESLQSMLDNGHSFSPQEAVRITIQIASGLDYAHYHDIIHRDVKPANIMITPKGSVKITDFGIAKVSSSSLTRTGQFLGTPFYVAPEQIVGGQIDGRSDLFSLSVLLYQVLTLEKPFAGDNITTIIYKIVHQEPPPPTQINVSLLPDFDQVLARGMAKNPANRYKSAREMMEDLECILNGEVLVNASAEDVAPEEADDGRATQPVDCQTAEELAESAMTRQAAEKKPVRGRTVRPEALTARAKIKTNLLAIGIVTVFSVVMFSVLYFLFVWQPSPQKPGAPHVADSVAARNEEPIETVAESAIPGEKTAQPLLIKRSIPEGTEEPDGEEWCGVLVSLIEEERLPELSPPEPAVLTPPVVQSHGQFVQEPTSMSSGTAAVADKDASDDGEEDPAMIPPADGETAGGSDEAAVPADVVGYLDFEFRHFFDCGVMEIRADGEVVFSERFGMEEESTSSKGALGRFRDRLKKRKVFEWRNISVPVGEYPIIVEVTVAEKVLPTPILDFKILPFQTRCITIENKRVSTEKLTISSGCDK